jgi:UDP-glucose:(heptosyl)LPS alpha-1,3-glucosyltransferase
LRLAVVSPFVDRRHGTERALAELLERLAREEHCEIHLYAQRVEGVSFELSATAGKARIAWHKVPSISGPYLLQFLSWLFSNWVCRTWDRRVHGARYDLVLSPGINCLDADVIIVHALFHRLQELVRAEKLPSAAPGILRRLHRRCYYALLSAFERRIYSDQKVSLAAVSPRIAELLSKYFRRQDVRVIPNGVDTAQFSPAARLARRGQARSLRHFREDDFILLLVGNDWGNKGLPSILEALPKLLDLPAKLLIVGSDAFAPSREMAARLRVLDRCIWEPARADILDAYAAADVYVSPSREDSFGMPVAEAMACGLPAITSVFAGVSALLHDGADSFVLRNPYDVELLARLLRMLCEQADLRTRLAQAAAKTALEWTWDRNAADVWEFLKEVNAKKDSA